jgi:hypothetical protein
LGVIPGKLAIASGPGIQENQKLLDTRFRGYGGGRSLIYFADFGSKH